MVSASSSIPYKGILAILCIILRLGPTDAITGYDCKTKLLNMTTVHLENQDPATREMLESNMKFGSKHPDEFAYQLMGGPGYMALVEEDKFYIVQCQPVEVILKQQDKCYNRLEILKGDERLFMTPWTYIITKTATELPCNSPLLQDSALESAVYRVAPRPEGSSSVLRLKPETTLTWKYQEIPNLATSGIYTEQQFYDWQLRQDHPNQVGPLPFLNEALPEFNANRTGVRYPNRKEFYGRWYETWNIYSITACVSVCVFIILGAIGIPKMISHRRRRQRSKSDHYDLKIKLNKLQDA